MKHITIGKLSDGTWVGYRWAVGHLVMQGPKFATLSEAFIYYTEREYLIKAAV